LETRKKQPPKLVGGIPENMAIPIKNGIKNDYIIWIIYWIWTYPFFPVPWNYSSSFNPFNWFDPARYQKLVDGIPTPLKNMSSSVGMMTFPIYVKIKDVPNHQPENI